MSPAVPVPSPERLARWAEGAVAKAPGKEAAIARGWLLGANPELHAHAEALLAALDRATRCRVCGRPLELEASQLAGIGPDCAAKRAEEAQLVARAVA